jgi:hypothetical protein
MRRLEEMAEKVLFEIRGLENEEGYSFTCRHGQVVLSTCGPFFWRCLIPFVRAGTSKSDLNKWAQSLRKHSRRSVRRTLDSFEKMYDEIYGTKGVGRD